MRESSPADESPTEREEILSILADTVRDMNERIEARELEDADDEHLQIKWIRALGYLAGQYRKLMKDTDIDEMEDELDLLQEATDVMEDDR